MIERPTRLDGRAGRRRRPGARRMRRRRRVGLRTAGRPRSWSGTATTDAQGKNFTALIDQYNKEHPDVEVTQLVSSSDLVLQKVLTAVRGGTPPDVAYMFGSWAPNIAKIPQVVDMTPYVKQPAWNWDDFYVGERQAATVGDKIVGVPALVDNLAIVYNKKLFQQAGIDTAVAELDLGRLPGGGQGVDRPVEEAVRLADPCRRQRGHGVALRRDAVGGGR